ncbi:MAG: hypothetical protein AAB575_00755 [Patescibacteria group bacterium]
MDERAFVFIEDTDIALTDSMGASNKRIVKAVKKALRENVAYWGEPSFLCARIFVIMVDAQRKSREACQFGITQWKHADAELVVAVNCNEQTIVVSDSRDDAMIDCSFEEFIALTDEEIGA